MINELKNKKFLANLTNQKPYLIKSFNKEFFIEHEFIHELFKKQAVEKSNFYLFNSNVKSLKEGRETLIDLITKEKTGINKINANSTLIIRRVQEVIPDINNIIKSFSSILNYPLNSNLYLSLSSSLGFPVHHDPHYVFAMQLSGAKEWWLYPPQVKHPMQRYSWDIHDYSESEKPLKFVTQKGDLLFIPLGWPHKAKTFEKNSIHITVGYNPIRWIDVIEKTLLELGKEMSILRAPIPISISEDNQIVDYKKNIDINDVKKILKLIDLRIDQNIISTLFDE